MSGLDPLYYNDHVRRLHNHKLPWWRLFLGPFCGLHFVLVAGHLYFDWGVLGPKYGFLRFLEILVVLLSVSSRVIWQYLFRDQYQFLHFRRPSRAYRGAIYAVSAATIIPIFILHFPIIYINFKADRTSNISYYQSILCLIVLLALCTYYLWMVHRFLLGDDHDAQYEPTASLLDEVNTSVLEPYSDDPPSTSVEESSSSLSGHLALAYALQQAISPLRTHAHTQGHDNLGSRPATIPPEAELGAAVSTAISTTDSTASTSSINQPGAPLRCATIAKFDYMPENRVGPHSWFSYHFATTLLGISSTVILVLVWQLIYEDKLSRLSFSSKAKCSLHVPLSGYILALYGATYRNALKRSVFTRSCISLPEHWTRIKSWMRKPVFVNSEAGNSTAIDPRRRKYEVAIEQKKVGTGSVEYINAYNASRQPCAGYWGHLGRSWITDFRTTSTVRHVIILGFAAFQFGKGYACIFYYPHEEGAKLPDNTIEDLQRFLRIMWLNLYLMFAGFPLGIFVLFFAAGGALSILILFGGFVLEHLPEEEKERLRQLREQARAGRSVETVT